MNASTIYQTIVAMAITFFTGVVALGVALSYQSIAYGAEAPSPCAGIGTSTVPGLPPCSPAEDPLADGYDVSFDNINRYVRVEVGADSSVYRVKWNKRVIHKGTGQFVFERTRLKVGKVRHLVVHKDGVKVAKVRLVPTRF